MTKKKKRSTRRSVSIPGALYVRLKSYCDEHDLAISAKVGDLVTELLDAAGTPVVTSEAYKAKLDEVADAKSEKADKIRSQHFTF